MTFNLRDDILEDSLIDQKLSTSENLSLWMNRWQLSLETKKVSSLTLKSYRKAIDTFIDFTKKYGECVPLNEIGARFINRYLVLYQHELAVKKYKKKKLSKSKLSITKRESNSADLGINDANFTILEEFENTLSQRLTIVKMFLKYIGVKNRDKITFNASFKELVHLKISTKFTEHLTTTEMDEVVKYITNWSAHSKYYKNTSHNRYAHRESLLVLLYILTGARGNEIVNVRLEDITEVTKNKVEYYIIRIHEAKGGKKREVSAPKEPLEELIEYFKSELPDDSYYISSTHRKVYTNKPTSADNIRKTFNKILSILGIKKSGLHVCRRGYATKRISVDKKGIAEVAKEMGNTVAVLEEHYLKHNAEAYL